MVQHKKKYHLHTKQFECQEGMDHWLCHQCRWETREGPKLSPEELLKLHVNFWMLYHSLQQSVSCWLDSYVARSWYRSPSPGPSVLTLEVGEVLDQTPFQSQRILHQSHSLLQVVVTSHGSCWSVWTKQTSLVGSPIDNLIVDDAQLDGQRLSCSRLCIFFFPRWQQDWEAAVLAACRSILCKWAR